MDPISGGQLNIESRRVLVGNKAIVPLVLQVLQKTNVPGNYSSN